MTVDQYALCPCGNGKKIKFCKCKDSLPELDRVMTMIEGRQVVPAIDRLNQVLDEHPDAAWALAIKGRLMIDLREYEALSENAERFVRLQPSNPLALAQRAAAEVFRHEPQKATIALLEALTESGRSVDSFVLDIASLLSYSLANAGLFLTARAYV
jgi:tetratricopeptide (TPR) repeat protein